MRVETKKLSDLNPAGYNPRRDLQPRDNEYKKLKTSILEFGILEAIVINERTGNMVGGHQKLKIMCELGGEPIIEYGKNDKPQLIGVREGITDCIIVDLPPEREKAANIALNKVTGEWDMPKLKDLLDELKMAEIDLLITGFDEAELEKLSQQFAVAEDEPEYDESVVVGMKTVVCPECGYEFSV